MGERAEDAERFERLIAAIEANTNAQAQLTRVLERKHGTKRQARTRRVHEPDAPIKVTPLVEAAVKRHLARIGR